MANSSNGVNANPANSSSELIYLPALDSLRGLAVIAVLLGHLDYFFFGEGFDLFPGGFFVLSGFLITRNLLHEHFQTGSLNLTRFYLHRALRLLPALALLLFLLFPTLWLLKIAPAPTLVEGALAIAFYYFNWYVYFTLENIPGAGHLWSLSVEEQFYLLWPGLLLLMAPLVSGRRWFWPVICVTAVLLAGAVRASGWCAGDSWLHLYLRTDLRADALMLGALVAFGEPRLRTLRVPVLVRFALLGVFPIAMLTLDNEASWMYLGGFTLLAIYGALLVFLGSGGHLRRGIPVLNHIGRISYGLYLCHMPIVLACVSPLAKQLMPSDVIRMLVALLLSLAVAALSYHYFERPFLALKKSS